MGTIQQLEQYLLLKLAHDEITRESLYGLYANEDAQTIFKSDSLIAATKERIYICTFFADTIYCEEIAYSDIRAVYHRQRNLSGKESIILTKEKRFAFSHIEEGCPVKFMQYVQTKIQSPFSTTA